MPLPPGVTSFHLRPLIRVIIEGVDPRDTQWEVDQPVYRVYFWHPPQRW